MKHILEHIQYDMNTYIIPELLKVDTLDEWNALKEVKKKRGEDKEIRLLLYFNQAHMLSCSKANLPNLLEFQKTMNLSNEDIRANIDLLKYIAEKSPWPQIDSRNYVLNTTVP